MKFSKIVNKELKQTSMLLLGELGPDAKQTNGDYFAQELKWQDDYSDEIEIRINCIGGSFYMGLSIVAELMAAKAYTTCIGTGIVASMAVPILISADSPKMYDYAKMMIHSPFYQDEKGAAVKGLSKKDQKALGQLKSILVELLMKRGLSEEKVQDLLSTDTWLTADEALELGLINEVVATGRKSELISLEPKALVAKLQAEGHESLNTDINMKLVIAKLGLPAESDEASVVEAVAALQNKTPEVTKVSDAVIAKVVAIGEKCGVVTEKNKTAMTTLAETNLDLFVDLLDESKLKVQPVDNAPRMSEVIAALKGGNQEKAVVKDYAYYEKNDPQALLKMKAEKPEEFQKLFDANFKQD